MSEAAKAFQIYWMNVHGPPEVVSSDIEFINKLFVIALMYFGTLLEPRTARRNSNLGVFERKNSVVRLLVQRLLKDAQYFSKTRDTVVSSKKFLASAAYLSNIF